MHWLDSLSSTLSMATTLHFLLKTLVILVGCLVAIRLIHLLSNQYRRIIMMSHRRGDMEEEKRITTVLSIFKSGLTGIIFTIAGLLILNELGLNIAPLLAGAGVLGIAVAFGTQSLVKDVFYGFFILAENQFGLGDQIQVGTLSGVVERMTFRIVQLREPDGRLHIIPNGEIAKVTVFPPEKPSTSLQVDITLPTDQVAAILALLQQEGPKLHQSQGDVFLEAPRLIQVEGLPEGRLHVKVLVKTLPQQEWKGFQLFQDCLNHAFLSLPGSPQGHFGAILPTAATPMPEGAK